MGWVPAAHTSLPRRQAIDAEWRLGVAATGLDVAAKRVRLAGASPGREAQLARNEEAIAAQLRALRSSEDAAAVAS